MDQNFLGVKEWGTGIFFKRRGHISAPGRGPEFIFSVGKGGTRFFPPRQRGGQKKMTSDHHKQTVPLPDKKMIAPLFKLV